MVVGEDDRDGLVVVGGGHGATISHTSSRRLHAADAALIGT
jgi:hypothetical protein